MAIYDGTEEFDSKVISGLKLDTTVVWKGTALPVGAANKVPQNGLFLLVDSLSAPTTKTWYIQSSATISSPSFQEFPSTAGEDTLPYLTPSTTIGNYTSPNAAVSSSDGTISPVLDDDFTGTDDWLDVGAGNFGVNISTDRFEFHVDATAENDISSIDLGLMSDTKWFIRGILRFSALTGSDPNLIIGISDTDANTDYISNQDWIGVRLLPCNSLIRLYHTNGAAPRSGGDADDSYTFSTGVNYYFEILRTSATKFDFSLSSTSGYTKDLFNKTLVGSISGSTTALRYLKIGNGTDEIGGTMTGYIDSITVWDGTNTSAATPNSVFDDSTSSYWISNSEASPSVYVDLSGSAREIVGVALNIDRTNTTITSIKIRASTDTSFDDTENIMYVNVSDFTDDTWRFLANNFLTDNRRYVQIIGVGTGVLAINEIKVRYGVSDSVKILSHRHHTRDVAQADSFVDSN